MTREEALEKIHDPAGLPVDPVELRELEVWLKRDPALRVMHEQQQALFGALDCWDAPEPSQSFAASLYARIAEEERHPAGWAAWFRRLLQPRPAAAAAACLAALILALGLPTAETPIEPVLVEKAELGVDEAEYYEALDQALEDVDMLLEFDAFAPESGENRS